MNIGLTGGIACGKSTVSQMFVDRGAVLVDADRVARDVVSPGRPALAAIREAFGDAVFLEDGTLHRKKLGERIFGDESAKRTLESIVHPVIRQELYDRIEYWDKHGAGKLVVFDIPLFFESGYQQVLPEHLVVYVPRHVQLQRLMERDGLSEEAAEARLRAQMDIEEKKRLAESVIDNSGTLAETERQVDEYIRRFCFE